MSDIDNQVVSAGQLIMLHAGEAPFGSYALGLFRGRVDLNFEDLAKEFSGTVPNNDAYEAAELPTVLIGGNPGSEDPMERGFTAWLLDRGLIERVPVVSVHLDGDRGRKHKFRSPWVSVQVSHPEPETNVGTRV